MNRSVKMVKLSAFHLGIVLLLIAVTQAKDTTDNDRRIPSSFSMLVDGFRTITKRATYTDLGNCYDNTRWMNAFVADCVLKIPGDCVPDKARKGCDWGKQLMSFSCGGLTGDISCHSRCFIPCTTDPVLPCETSLLNNPTCNVKRRGVCSRSRGVGTFPVRYYCRDGSGTQPVCLQDCCCQRFPRGGVGTVPDKLCTDANVVAVSDRIKTCTFTYYP